MRLVRLALLAGSLSAILSMAMFPQVGTSKGSPSQSSNLALIVPGKSVGPLALGASREMVEQVFPFKKGMDQEDTYTSPPSCGSRTEINWLDFDDKGMGGNVFVYIRENHVFQIESSATRFRTSDGIASGASPAAVKLHYKNLKAYVLTGGSSYAEGGRDFIYWVDQTQGMAFQFAYNSGKRARRLYKMIVFQPGAEYAPEGCIDPRFHKWLEMPPYSLGE